MLRKLTPVFESLERHNVHYLVIGGVAAVLHGIPRMTFDLDILIENDIDVADRFLQALGDAGIETAKLIGSGDLLEDDATVFADVIRIDLRTRIKGLDFCAAWRDHFIFEFEGCPIHILNRLDLIASKRAAGRPIDLEDVRLLELD